MFTANVPMIGSPVQFTIPRSKKYLDKAPKAPPKGKASYEETSEYITSGDYKRQPKKALGGKVEDYNKGGKVAAGGGESNPYGWPSRDARNGGKG